VKRKDFQILAALRLKDAKVLLRAGCHEGAYYLAGYAVECALKACIAKRTDKHDFPDRARAERSFVHNLEALAIVADVHQALADRTRSEKWGTVRKWSEQSRYRQPTKEEAASLVDAVADRRHGILPWLKLHW
jgi:HEPN domain-containing protein